MASSPPTPSTSAEIKGSSAERLRLLVRDRHELFERFEKKLLTPDRFNAALWGIDTQIASIVEQHAQFTIDFRVPKLSAPAEIPSGCQRAGVAGDVAAGSKRVPALTDTEQLAVEALELLINSCSGCRGGVRWVAVPDDHALSVARNALVLVRYKVSARAPSGVAP